MTASDSSANPASPRAQAVHWFAKAQLGTLTPDDQQAFAAWLASDPRHAQAYQALQGVWQVADHLPRDAMRAILERTDEPRAWSRRHVVLGAGAACASVLVAGVLSRNLWASEPGFTQQLSTARGARKVFDLPDGSRIDLNTDSALSVALYDDRRVVELHRGEALFSVSADPTRPFWVDAGEATVRVTGTQFNVRRDPQRVTVAVAEGAVDVSAGPWWRRQRASLTAGQVSVASPADGLAAPYRARVDALIAWQRGRLVFRDRPLSEVADELNRYLDHPLRVADATVGRLRVSGTLSIEAPEAVLDLLPDIAPVLVLRRPEGGAMLVAR